MHRIMILAWLHTPKAMAWACETTAFGLFQLVSGSTGSRGSAKAHAAFHVEKRGLCLFHLYVNMPDQARPIFLPNLHDLLDRHALPS